MGVSTVITLEAPTREIASEAASAAYARIAEIEDAASDYRPGSELMRLCREARPGVWWPVSNDLARLLAVSRQVAEQTGGAFDATVGPAVGLWREARRTGQMPAGVMLEAARARIDWRAVEVDLDSTPARVRLMKEGIRLDLGGIAKGYAAQEAGKVLEERGLRRCLVALAGDIYAGEPPSGQEGWRIQVRGDKSERVIGTLLVAHACISTSGDTEQFVEVGGVRYSHIIDPRTGIGTVGGQIVTAIGTDGAFVDAADTASVVMGLERMSQAFERDSRVTLIVHRADQPPTVIGDPTRVRWMRTGTSE